MAIIVSYLSIIYTYIYIHQLSLIHINYYEFQKKYFFWEL